MRARAPREDRPNLELLAHSSLRGRANSLSICAALMEGAHMSKEDHISYVADMAQQLAELARDHLPAVAKLLEVAAELARDGLQKTR